MSIARTAGCVVRRDRLRSRKRDGLRIALDSCYSQGPGSKSQPVRPLARAAERRITQPHWNGKTLSGQEFLNQHVIPNFYFHVSTAYAILRHNGIGIGKKNYLGDMSYREAA